MQHTNRNSVSPMKVTIILNTLNQYNLIQKQIKYFCFAYFCANIHAMVEYSFQTLRTLNTSFKIVLFKANIDTMYFYINVIVYS